MRDDSDDSKLTRRRFNLMTAAALLAAPAARLTAHAQQQGRGKGGGARPAVAQADSLRVEQSGLPAGQPKSHWEVNVQVEEEPRFRIHDVPPIIVDSGSFEMGLPGNLSDATDNPGSHTRRKKMQTLIEGFTRKVLGVRVFVYNEVTGFVRNDLWTDTSGMQVQIWLQKLRPPTHELWNPDDLVGEAHVLLRGGPPFTVEIDQPLADRSDSVHGKKTARKSRYRHDDNKTKVFRFGQVEIDFSSGGWVRYVTGENEEYRISLWDELGPS